MVINDCYNANPMSMRAALDHLAAVADRRGARRVVAVLGDMRELGPGAPEFHREIGALAAEAGVEVLVAVGEHAADYVRGFGRPAHEAPDAERAAELAADLVREGDVVLVKASRGVGLERVTENARRRTRRAGLMGEILIAGLASLLISIFLGPKFIEYLRAREFGQHIREEGPAEHQMKAGTPTMGGLVIFTAIGVPYLILSDRDAASMAVFGTALACAAIGFADDWLKIVKARSLGLSARTKLSLQALIAIGLWLVARETVGLGDTLQFRIFDGEVDLGGFYVVLIFLVLAGATNGVNLTDGLDGLAAGCGAIVLLSYTAIAFITGGQDGLSITEQDGLSLLGACLVGASVGFLWFNSFPAAIFMGDTGSLGLGGAIAGLAVMTKSEVLLIVIGGIFVIEALSVAAQVIAFRLFRRRVLLMAPIHHHFELLGWSETKIIVRFWITAAICSAIGFTLYQQSIGA